MGIDRIKDKLNKNKKLLTQKYKVKDIGIFGSYAKGNPSIKSDIDILVEFSSTPDFFEFIELEDFLKSLIGIKVDLVTKKALKPLIKDEILKEIVYV